MKPHFGKIISELRSSIGQKFIYTDNEKLEAYNFDGTDLRYWPDIVVEPENRGQVSQLMKIATKYRIPVIPRGAGTGVTGGALPVKGGIVLSLLRMNKILSIDEINMTAFVEPGVINLDLHHAVSEKGLYYPPDPASYDTSTIGGNIAEDAGGPHCFKYGTTRDYILGLEIVLSDGTIMNTGVQTRKGVVGYDLTNLIVGSEGTLAIVTKAILRLIPLPARTITLLAFFSDIQTLAGDACFQNDALDVLLAESSEKRENLWAVRRKFRDLIKERSQFKFSEDVTVPIRQIPQLIEGARKIAAKHEFQNYNYGHLGDGNVHVNFTHHHKDETIVRRSESVVRELFELTVKLGGTISGEHGIGITKMNFLEIELSKKSIELQKKIKQVFDPLNILNPFKIFPPE
ncbi:hypothetical protein B6D60_06960 [candidate division KSB1 bacterium 4484_87]|nr:MAG: hypothetical protein B6D60_06960 [candidate division KSB1 bacterium 4484_87]